MKYAVAGLSLLVMVSSTLVANSGKNAPAPYQKPLVQGKSVMEMAEVQSQPSSQAGSHPETGKAGDKSVTKGVDTDGARDTADLPVFLEHLDRLAHRAELVDPLTEPGQTLVPIVARDVQELVCSVLDGLYYTRM